jgi:integrase
MLYYSALRPAEAINLRRNNVALPRKAWNPSTGKWEEPPGGWGEFHLERAAPAAGRSWTDSGRDRDDRGLKHRAPDAVRVVPIPSELVVILRAHLDEFGTRDDGRLFGGALACEVPVVTYNQVCRKARAGNVHRGRVRPPLAERHYTLRHACV